MNKKHGMTNTSIWRRWVAMIQRCHDPRHVYFHRYGGRGIAVCPEWRTSFPAFYRDVGDPPTPRHQLDRIDNDLGYSKTNCRWATPAENNRNKANTKLRTADVAELLRLAASGVGNPELAERFGILPHTVATMKWKHYRDADAAANRERPKGHRDAGSRYRGVSWSKQISRWQVRIQSDYLGTFKDEQNAARAYDAEALRRFGAKAKLNFQAQPVPA